MTTHKTWSLVISFLGVALCLAPARAALIDTFTSGTIANTSAPPSQLVDQAVLPGVIGSGDRDVSWQRNSGPGTVDLDLNNLVPGNALLSSSAVTVGTWVFTYGVDAPFNVDLTDGGLSNSFVVYFAAADVGTMTLTAVSTNAWSDAQSVPIPSLPGGGFVAIPFALFNPVVNFNNIAMLLLTIEGVEGGDYQMEILNTQFVPEPSSVALLLLGAVGLALPIRRCRKVKS